jgi:NAD(P)-dependent dehydrogenase (short-subunit alcohol dehydrogenase family)
MGRPIPLPAVACVAIVTSMNHRSPSGTVLRVLITGATSGIGRACAEYAAARGLTVMATGRNRKALAELQELARARSWNLHARHLDVTDTAEASSVAEEARMLFGGIDALMNNAGVGQAGFLADITTDQLRAQFAVSLFGLFDVTRAFLPQLMEHRGIVLNVGSIMGRMTAPWMGAYGAAKAAVRSLTETMRVELGAVGVRVVLLEPGALETSFQARTVAEREQAGTGSSPFAAANRWLRENSYRPFSMMRSVPSAAIARLVHHIIESRRPRPRYVAPAGARLLLLFMAATPRRLLDPLKRRIFHVMAEPTVAR